ncbi:MAG: hypothetical protein HQK49_14315 [Oligoflexia bacterium]|nr:hypothetical protein [Oligoflexia bacterium]
MKLLWQNRLLVWLILFILVNLIIRGTGDANQNSRYMTMRAICNDYSFQTNKYIHWTDDWAKTPDGNYYSIKAPGPMLLTFPLFCFMDFFSKTFDKKHWQNWQKFGMERTPPGPAHTIILTLFTQIIPFAIIVGMLILYLQRENYPFNGIYFMTLALLFGNTSALFMNTFFGHGIVAFFMVAMIYFLLKENFKLVGLFFALSLLSDYMIALAFPPLILTIFLINKTSTPTSPPKKWMLNLFDISIGGFIPALLWCWYHYSSFGGIFTIANTFSNPDVMFGKNNLSEFFSSSNGSEILYQLLIGKSRGMLYTVPWILFFLALSIPLLLKNNKNLICNHRSHRLHRFHKPLILFSLISFFLFILLNSTFVGWHSGSSPGPRYISAIFPVFAIVIALEWNFIPKMAKLLLWIMLGFSILFRNLVCATTILSKIEGGMGIWEWHVNYLIKDPLFPKHLLRFIILMALFALALLFTHLRKKIYFCSANQL